MREKKLSYKSLSEMGNFMICPNCGTEVTAEFTGQGKPCPKCGTRMLFSGLKIVQEMSAHSEAWRSIKTAMRALQGDPSDTAQKVLELLNKADAILMWADHRQAPKMGLAHRRL